MTLEQCEGYMNCHLGFTGARSETCQQLYITHVIEPYAAVQDPADCPDLSGAPPGWADNDCPDVFQGCGALYDI